MLCISTRFWVLHAPKSWSNYFFQPFSTFFAHFKPFSVISRLKSTKNIWKRTKNVFLSTPQNWSTCKSWLTPWGGTSKLSFFGWFFYSSLATAYELHIKRYSKKHAFISAVKSLTKFWNEHIRLKNGWKKCFDQLLGARITQKLVEIHNIWIL